VQFQNTSVGTPTSSAIGENNVANGNFSFVGGEQSNSLSDFSFIFGQGNTSTMTFSTIFGRNINANNSFVFSFGDHNTSQGEFTFSFGTNLINNGNNSFLSGQSITNNGATSFCLGNNLNNSTGNSFLFGNYVSTSTNANNSFVIGNGILGNPLINNLPNSFMIGLNSNMPTLFIGTSNGANTTGNIGIATTTPGSKLQVNGNVAIGYNASVNGPSNGLIVNGNLGVGTINPQTKLQINGNTAIGYTTAPTNGLTVAGNIGIGINNPSAKLHVNGNALIGYNANVPSPHGALVNGSMGIGIETTTAPYGVPFGKLEIKQTGSDPALLLRTDHTGNTPFISFYTNKLLTQPYNQHPFYEIAEFTTGNYLTSTNTEPKTLNLMLKNNHSFLVGSGAMFIGYDNNAVGDVAPFGLNVKGDVSIGMDPIGSKALSVNGNMLGTGELYLGPLNSGNSSFLLSGGTNAVNIASIGYDMNNPSNNPAISNRNEFNFMFTKQGAFNFYKSKEKYLFTITTDGDVGINQADPQATLHIVEESFDINPAKYKDAIRIDGGPSQHPHFIVKSNGFVYAREINVQLGNLPTKFPDYVFSPDYNLTPLSELNSYIDTNRHLPEVPDANQMAADGINTGEMNMILLKKVEELTLYIIELNKRIDALEEEKNKDNSSSPQSN